MTNPRFVCTAAIGAGLACTLYAQQPDFNLHDGDHAVFYGDSITDQRNYTMQIELFVATRYPKMHVQFTNSGWGGDRVTGGGGGDIDLRLQRDVTAYKPTVITIMLGMNDGGYKTAVGAVTLNGKPIHSSQIDHSALASGGNLVFTMRKQRT